MLKGLIQLRPIKIFTKKLIDPFQYQKGALLLFSAPIAFLDVVLEWFYNTSFLGVNLTFISLLVLLMVCDFWTGLRASQKEGEPIKSEKLVYTFFKFLSSFAFFLIIFEVDKIIRNANINSPWFSMVLSQAEYLVSFVRSFVFIILISREFISVGENIERKFGQKPYIFILVEKIAVQIELKLIKKIEQSDLCPDEKDETNKKL